MNDGDALYLTITTGVAMAGGLLTAGLLVLEAVI